jgi:hypothetical protein
MEFILTYQIGDKSLVRKFTSPYDLERFVEKICEVKAIQSCSYEVQFNLK